MKPSSKASKRNSTTVEFADNRLLSSLFGEHHSHLTRIEQMLDVEIAARGNKLVISGPDPARYEAKETLQSLYKRLTRNEEISMGDVEGALRIATIAAAKDEDGSETGDIIRTPKRHISPRSKNQVGYLRALRDHELVFGVGPAGTGKTYLAVAKAVSLLIEGHVERIILSRPAVEAGEHLGFLPGDMQEKVDPYLRPLYDAIYDMLPAEHVTKRIESGEIEVAPLAFMRGRTLAHSFIILDEAQNCTPVQMKMFLTRLGEGAHMAITGDPSQVDLPKGNRSGLTEALDILSGVEGVGVIRFGEKDVVRHPLVTRIVRAYNAHDKKNLPRSGTINRG